MWFAAISSAYARGWLPVLLDRLLAGDRGTLRLLRSNPFPDEPPVWVRARLYDYRFTTRAEHRATGDWWVRGTGFTYIAPRRRPVRATRER